VGTRRQLALCANALTGGQVANLLFAPNRFVVEISLFVGMWPDFCVPPNALPCKPGGWQWLQVLCVMRVD
jgi:hypothetical protein